MKKVLNKKFSSSSKLVRKILSRSEVKQSKIITKNDAFSMNEPLAVETSLKNQETCEELVALKAEIASLKLSITSLQFETEAKDSKLAELAREKETLSLSLLKTKRSNSTLSQQLEDERNFYYKEKADYCREMNQVKKIKKVLSSTNFSAQIGGGAERGQLQKALDDALHTNYNLSVKFFRIRDAKSSLELKLDKARKEHQKVVEDLRSKIETLSREMANLLDEKFAEPSSPSSRKYLQLVKQNNALVYENLCLQMHVDHLHQQLGKNKVAKTQSEPATGSGNALKAKKMKKKKKPTFCQHNIDDKGTEAGESSRIITIFERTNALTESYDESEASSGLKGKHSKSDGKISVPELSDSKLTVFQVSEVQSQVSVVSQAVRKKRSRSAPKIIQSVYLRDIINIK